MSACCVPLFYKWLGISRVPKLTGLVPHGALSNANLKISASESEQEQEAGKMGEKGKAVSCSRETRKNVCNA